MKTLQEINYEQAFQDFIDKFKAHDFSYLADQSLDKWKKGINQEYLLRKEIQTIVSMFGIDESDRICKICLDQIDDIYYKNVVHTQIKMMFYPYTNQLRKGNTPMVSEFKLKNHASLKRGNTDKMS